LTDLKKSAKLLHLGTPQDSALGSASEPSERFGQFGNP
jgi:hypothetical protein